MIVLRPYQQDVARAVIKMVGAHSGGSVAVAMARQSGKNETSAWIERTLLLRYFAEGGTGIKAAPTLKPQAQISRDRLARSLRESGAGRFVRQGDPWTYFGRARWGFFGAGKESNVIGHTADILLEADEAQDIAVEKFDKDFRPMVASTNAPVVFYGTPWLDDDLLAQARASSSLEFVVPWSVAAEHNPAYAEYVASERERLGANHPLFITQYEMQTLPGGGRLLSAAQLATVHGPHERERQPTPRASYVAGIDVAGEDTAGTLRGRDATVCTIGRVIWGDRHLPPCLDIVEQYAWTGTAHSALYDQLAALMNSWKIRDVAVDSTTLGEALAILLQRALGKDRVIAYRFTERSKSDLGYALQASATTGRLKMWANDQSPEYTATMRQLAAARATYKPNRTVAWAVPESEGHDDHLVSVALVNHAATEAAPPRIARGI